MKSGAIKRFVVMAGCYGRQKARGYFTEVAENLPKDTVILTQNAIVFIIPYGIITINSRARETYFSGY